ncbi:DNA replication/repair protein RecF [Dyella sp. EPa41]|uniref:DNA replication/repair protein RecF n=1 Tax=Dyella sp. EPa41 TaxID=1561194 RepID=UPI00191674D5|nr:DNA replication/repair protein RecF [Dyella sp. EPa41]
MRLESLRIQGLRCLADVTVPLSGGVTVFAGPNGAGKTSLLEAAFLLSHARSFRAGAKDALLQRGADQLSIFAQLRHEDGQARRLGLGRQGVRWEARMDGQVVTLSELVGECAVVCFEPGSHALIAGGAEERRRYLDWGVFHVEHEFFLAWRRYQRALKQRNSLLRAPGPVADALFLPWEAELASAAEIIDRQRRVYLDALRPHIGEAMEALLPELGGVELRYKRGWSDDADLGELLAAQRGRDLARGHTTLGSHRADWSVVFEHAPQREHLSRGQEKLTALGCVLSQAALYAERKSEWPVVCLDDLASELDKAHQAALVHRLKGVGAQVLVTGTDVPEALQDATTRVFHVEQGTLNPLL